jgi:hypothetical protein
MTIDNRGYIAAYESHHVAHLESFSDYEKAATFLHGWTTDVHTWPICIYNAENDQLWLWCGYRTLDISRESALEDSRAILRLPADHKFKKIAIMAENL